MIYNKGNIMTNTAIVSILCPDEVGLIADVAGCLFDQGANLADTTFAALGGGAEFTTICELPDGIGAETIDTALRQLEKLKNADITVLPFEQATARGDMMTHRVVISGGDRPGLVARLCEVFGEFKANIIRLNSEKIQASGEEHYVIRAAVSIPEKSEKSCMATVANTAGELGLHCNWRE
jgi:glycine cleavage system transcriptional repressor